MNRVGAFSLAAVCIIVLVSAIFAQTSNPSPKKTPPQQDYTFPVAAGQVWTDTGLDLEAGDRVHIYGTVTACEGVTPREKAHLPLPSAPGGALLTKVHAEAAPILASPDADLPILNPSHLYLGVNGWHCHGTLPAKVHVVWHKRAEESH